MRLVSGAAFESCYSPGKAPLGCLSLMNFQLVRIHAATSSLVVSHHHHHRCFWQHPQGELPHSLSHTNQFPVGEIRAVCSSGRSPLPSVGLGEGTVPASLQQGPALRAGPWPGVLASALLGLSLLCVESLRYGCAGGGWSGAHCFTVLPLSQGFWTRSGGSARETAQLLSSGIQFLQWSQGKREMLVACPSQGKTITPDWWLEGEGALSHTHTHTHLNIYIYDSVQFSHSVVSNSLRPHESPHARPPCPSPAPKVYSNSCLSSRWCHPAISSSVVPFSSCPQIPPSIRIFSNESTLCMRWPKYWSFSFSISPSNELPGLISFRMDWLDLLAVQGTLKSLLQHHSSKAAILWCSTFIIVQLSHPYMTTGKTIALTRRTFVGKVMSLFLICCLGWS